MYLKKIGAGFFLLLLSLAVAKFVVNPLRPPFELTPITASRPSTPINCQKIPTPPRALNFSSVYKKEDKTRSIEDPAAIAAYKEAIKPITQFENHLTNYANEYLRSGGASKRGSHCALNFLAEWAKEKTFLGPANDQGIAVRKWTLSTLATSYAQISNDPTLSILKKWKVENWLRGIAVQTVKDYSSDHKISRRNNHLYWAAWSVAMTGAAINDPVLFRWGMAQGQRGLAEIEIDGSLAEELARGSRALHYHIFAATPLLMLDLLARSNDYVFQRDYPGRLDALLRLNIEGLENPRYFEALTGTAQDVSKIFTPYSLAWLEIYDCRNPLLVPLRPLNQNRLGGDITLLYSRCIVK